MNFRLIKPIVIKEIPTDIKQLEDSRLFNFLVKTFINYTNNNPNIFDKYKNIYWLWKNESINLEQIKANNSLLKHFEDYIQYLSLTWQITIDKKCIWRVIELKKDFEKRSYNVLQWTSVIKYYDEIYARIFWPVWLTKNDKTVKSQLLAFNHAYHMMKHGFSWKVRKWKLFNEEATRYFEHLKWTMEIVLRELPNPNMTKIILALLHDCKEDLWLPLEDIKILFWEEIAEWVELLSKNSYKYYFTQDEKDFFEEMESRWLCDWIECKEIILTAKSIRNHQYFSDLDLHDDNVLGVKFADRLHNLRTISTMPLNHIIRKTNETKEYFLKVAEKRNKIAYQLLMDEINKLEKIIRNWWLFW